MPSLSVLDLLPFCTESTTAQAIRNSVELAQMAERRGFRRFWLAEHHSIGHLGCSAPEILIGHIAAATSKIQIGAGGMMLNNHPPLRIAEVFKTLEALYPGRIDLGIGRTPGGNKNILRALRAFPANAFEAQLRELVGLSNHSLSADHPLAKVHVVPSDVKLPPVWILGASGGTAQLAGALGLGYAFGRHLREEHPGTAFTEYRNTCCPSQEFPKPYAILCVSVICAPTEEAAKRIAHSSDVAHVQRAQNEFSSLPSVTEASNRMLNIDELKFVEENQRRNFVGTPLQVVNAVRTLAEEVQADEIMITTMIHNQKERLMSYELFVDEWNRPRKVQRNPYAYTADLGREVVLMSVENSEYFKVDAIALDIWNRLEEPIEVEKLCNDLALAYKGDPNVISREVVTLLGFFEKHNLLHS